MSYRWFPPNRAHEPLVALDFEASRLPGPGSYPIEVAVAHADGRVRSWLLKPGRLWEREGVWDTEAERVHGISRELLERDGVSVLVAAQELLEEIAGCCVVVGHSADEDWLSLLCRAADLPTPWVETADTFYQGWALDAPDVEEAIATLDHMIWVSDQLPLARHRAAPDAQRLMAFLLAATSTSPTQNASMSPAGPG